MVATLATAVASSGGGCYCFGRPAHEQAAAAERIQAVLRGRKSRWRAAQRRMRWSMLGKDAWPEELEGVSDEWCRFAFSSNTTVDWAVLTQRLAGEDGAEEDKVTVAKGGGGYRVMVAGLKDELVQFCCFSYAWAGGRHFALLLWLGAAAPKAQSVGFMTPGGSSMT